MLRRQFIPLAFAAAAASTLRAWPAAAQTSTPQATPPAGGTLSVRARLVTLPVTVRDKKGKVVTGLTAADFQLAEDGRPQTIKSFTTDTNLPLTLGLLVDTSGSMRDLLDRERSASQGFFASMLTRPEDKAFLLHFDREVELLEDLTSSKEKLNRALDQLGPTRAEADDAGSSSSGNDNGNSRPRRMGGTTLYDAIFLAADDELRKQPGRKAVVVLSDGEDRGSKETLHSAIEAAQRAEVSVYTVYFKGEEHQGYGNGNPGMGRRGGMGYPGGGYPGGGYPGGGGGYPGGGGGYPRGGGGGSSQESHVDGKKIMEQIAVETGGRYFEAKKKENLDDIYAAISEELRTQYVLTYTPDAKSTDEDGFHKILLTTSKKDVFVQTRPGYYSGNAG